jgi:UDP-glucose:(heptosyl)LPS alpha-1,3-glucosyltransferase
MKLALVRQKYNPFGGAERFVERALFALQDIGIDVTLVTRNWPEDAGGRNVMLCNPFHVGRLWRDVGFAHCVQALVAQRAFDLVQSHERIPGCDIYRAGDGVHATWLSLRGRLQSAAMRPVTQLHPWHQYTLAAESAMFNHVRLRAVICNSRMVADDIARRFGLPREKLHVIYNGVDLEHFNPGLRDQHRVRVRGELGVPADVPVFIHVGSGFERKGVPQTLAALARMRNRKTQLLVVGRDKQQEAMLALAARLGVAERVRFLGGQLDVRPYYGAADVFVLPTLYDPLPNAALEALASGLPLLTSTTCGAAELIEDGLSGFVCDALDVATLADRFDRHDELDANAARAAVAQLSLPDMASKLTDLYRSLAAPTQVLQS